MDERVLVSFGEVLSCKHRASCLVLETFPTGFSVLLQIIPGTEHQENKIVSVDALQAKNLASRPKNGLTQTYSNKENVFSPSKKIHRIDPRKKHLGKVL